MAYRQPLIVEKFNANTNAEKTIQDRLTNIFLAIEEANPKYLENCVMSAEAIIMSKGIGDEEFLYNNLKLREKWNDEYEAKLEEYKDKASGSLCPDVVDKPRRTPSMAHLLERTTLIVEFCQRKGIFLRRKNKLHYGN